MKIAIMGTGGLGGYFGGRLAHAGLDVTFIARGAHLQAIRENGLQVKSPTGDFLVKPAKATDNPAEVGPVDLILFCVKAYDAASAAEQMKPMVGAQTTVIPMLNGIGHIETLNAIVGSEHILGGCTNANSHIAAPGVIQYVTSLSGMVAFGELQGGSSTRCESIQQALAAGNFGAAADPNIVYKLWDKFVGVCAFALCCVVRGNYGVTAGCPEALELVFQAATEVVAVGQAKGVKFPASTVDDFRKGVAKLPPHVKSSMMIALERGHRLEVEHLNGVVSRYGKELGVPTPVNDFIYACLKPWANGAPQ